MVTSIISYFHIARLYIYNFVFLNWRVVKAILLDSISCLWCNMVISFPHEFFLKSVLDGQDSHYSLYIKLTGKMQIFVQGQNTNVYDISPSVSVSDLKELISFRSGIPTENQVLTYAGHALDDESSLSEYEVADSSTINLGIRMLGGKNFLTFLTFSIAS